ncbi:TPA: TIGR03757 family integrating conjugative element protein, partial [Klebsiella pneumoniae]|nr:TIGR03757 family integrating conjugative element protein [Klebsiella pneumoniae]
MQRLLIIIASLVLAGQACADVVLYTDRHHPPLDNDPQVTVVWLDAPDT